MRWQILYLKELIKHVEYNMYNDRRRPLCFTFHQETYEPTFFDTREEVNDQMKSFRKERKAGQIVLNERYLFEKQIDKRPIYGFTIQQIPMETNPEDPLALTLGIQISGMTYWFFQKGNRDKMFQWINK